MTDGLEPGVTRVDEFTVDDRLATDVGGTIGIRVLSTPGLIGMMERTASILAIEHLPEGRATALGGEIPPEERSYLPWHEIVLSRPAGRCGGWLAGSTGWWRGGSCSSLGSRPWRLSTG
ncbi:MAG: hypothetical protein ABI726_09875 [bacterium]